RRDGVVVGDEEEFIPAGVIIWASGVTTHDVVGQWGLPQGRGKRISVDDHLQVQGLDRVWAVGDVAVEDGDRALPQLAQPAMQTGKYVGTLLDAKINDGVDVGRFDYRDLGTMATIGRTAAVAEIRHLPSITGLPGWLIWMGVHLYQLLGNRNRVASMINLGAKYLFWGSNHNAIVGETRHRVKIPEE
ncbi:MAG TPA: FAD-dependent oxidoreductase, partial [Ruania sp.]|nr:FAD-dependent oxidoreductase [Ruania sp.]